MMTTSEELIIKIAEGRSDNPQAEALAWCRDRGIPVTFAGHADTYYTGKAGLLVDVLRDFKPEGEQVIEVSTPADRGLSVHDVRRPSPPAEPERKWCGTCERWYYQFAARLHLHECGDGSDIHYHPAIVNHHPSVQGSRSLQIQGNDSEYVVSSEDHRRGTGEVEAAQEPDSAGAEGVVYRLLPHRNDG